MISTNDSECDKDLKETWKDFLRALKSPTRPFNPFSWIYRLARAFVKKYVFGYRGWKHQILPLIPIFAIALIVCCALSYPLSLRSVIQERWCCSNDHHEASPQSTANHCNNSRCYWMYLHDFLIVYLPGMMLYHFMSACLSSPGVALARDVPEWMACKGQGGFAGYSVRLDQVAEEKRVALYGPLVLERDAASSMGQSQADPASKYFPSLNASYCDKCNIVRPPRSHHCSTSNRCVLQFDHFCIWLNNSIGYYNYRSFFLLLFYTMATCWYGSAILFLPFYEPLKAQVNENGWRWLYSNGTGFLNLPPIMDLARMALSGTLPSKAVIDIIYPLIFGVGGIISAFFGYHVKYVLRARTTLEHRVLLERSMISLFHTGSTGPAPVNPFDQGWRKNLVQVLGPNLFLVFTPFPIQIPPPYIPEKKNPVARVVLSKQCRCPKCMLYLVC